MRRPKALLLTIVCLSLASVLAGEQTDTRGCKDSPLFTRMPGYWISSCSEKQFDSHAFEVGNGKTESVEGKLTDIRYYPRNDLTSKPSDLQITRNFENAVRRLGGTVVMSRKGKSTFRLNRDGKEIWIENWAEFTGKYGLTIVEKGGMAQDVTANAEALSNDIRSTGHAAVYGIYFDTGKSVLKPESAHAVAEIAKLLKSDPALKVFVVGHTDNVGGVESNLKLSQSRAEAVMQALTRDHGIAGSRLRSFGSAQFAPVASNDSEDGRAKNRRVEVVKQ